MDESSVHEKLSDQSDAIDMIAEELTFLLTEAQNKNPAPGSPLGNELAQRFMALYEDLKTVREKGVKLAEEIDKVKFTDSVLELIYRATAHVLVEKMGKGLFGQFISVAEYGQLPDGTSFDESA